MENCGSILHFYVATFWLNRKEGILVMITCTVI